GVEATAEAPAQCAAEIRRAQRDHQHVQLRMGIHSGPISGVVDVNERANLAGAGINTAKRVMDCSDAGHILLAKHVAEDLEEYEKWRPFLHDLGTCEAKHGVRVSVVNLYDDQFGNATLPRKLETVRKRRARVRWAEVAVALLVLAAIIAAFVLLLRRPTRSALAIVEKSIAVLPFENLSRDPDNAYFADGIQEEILTRLASIADLRVISRSSTSRFKSKPRDLAEIAKQLRVVNILEGGVQKAADQVRVSVQLVNAQTGSHLWAETYDRNLTDVFGVESEISKGIAESLQAKLTGREEQALTVKSTSSPDAYDAYLRGLAYTLKTDNTPANALGAQKYLREAVRLDPKFALSWALLSYVDARGYLTETLQPTLALREEARQAAETAVTLQPTLGEAIIAKGHYYYACLKDYNPAVRYFEQARQFLPNNSLLLESLAFLERRRGHWDQSET